MRTREQRKPIDREKARRAIKERGIEPKRVSVYLKRNPNYLSSAIHTGYLSDEVLAALEMAGVEYAEIAPDLITVAQQQPKKETPKQAPAQADDASKVLREAIAEAAEKIVQAIAANTAWLMDRIERETQGQTYDISNMIRGAMIIGRGETGKAKEGATREAD